jgi:hypothetical protein
MKCGISTIVAPPDCPVQIIHALTVDDGGVRSMPRRSGKTSALVRKANELVEANCRVALVAPTKDDLKRLKRDYGLSENVIAGTVGGWGKDARGGDWRRVLLSANAQFMLFDEVNPHVVEEIMNNLIQARLVAAYYTP